MKALHYLGIALGTAALVVIAGVALWVRFWKRPGATLGAPYDPGDVDNVTVETTAAVLQPPLSMPHPVIKGSDRLEFMIDGEMQFERTGGTDIPRPHLIARSIPARGSFSLQLPIGAAILEVLSGPQILYTAEPTQETHTKAFQWVKLEDMLPDHWDWMVYIGHWHNDSTDELLGLFTQAT